MFQIHEGTSAQVLSVTPVNTGVQETKINAGFWPLPE